ncbi:MAG: sialidase family protein, partial [Nocardioides sp.]
WQPSQGGGIPSGVDHQTIGGGPQPKGVSNLPTTSYKHAVYYCSQDIAAAFCAASMDGGQTFGAGVPTYDMTRCGGIHGHVKVAPDGTAFLPNKSCGANQAVVVSTDGGQSWAIRPVPGSTPGDSDPSVGVSHDGTVYFGYVGADGKPAVAVSHDRGNHWHHRQTVGTEYHLKNAVFPTVVAGGDKRAAFAYLGTPTGGDYQNAKTFKGVWHLYVTYTYDGGKTWVTSDATPHDPVQRGSICTAGTTCGADRNLLDFIDVTIDKHGRVLVGYADGCIKACVTDPSKNGHDAYTTIARQSSGKTLFAKYD